MCPCKDRVGVIYCATSGSAGSTLTRQRRGNSIGAVIGDPTEETGKGTEGQTPVRTRRDSTTEAPQDAVAEEAVPLVGDRTNRGGRGALGVNGNRTNTPHQDG